MVYICLAEKAGEINVVKVSALPFFNDSAPSCIQICYYHCCLPYSRRAVVACTSLFNCCLLLLIVVVEIKENDYSISGFYPVFQFFTLSISGFWFRVSGFYPVYFRFLPWDIPNFPVKIVFRQKFTPCGRKSGKRAVLLGQFKEKWPKNSVKSNCWDD